MRPLAIGIIAAAALAGPAAAQERTGYQQIAAGDFAAAQAVVEAESRTFPRRPDLLLNLAALRARAGRAGEARALYRDVLARAEQPMDLPTGEVASSHALARAGLSRLDPVRVTAR